MGSNDLVVDDDHVIYMLCVTDMNTMFLSEDKHMLCTLHCICLCIYYVYHMFFDQCTVFPKNTNILVLLKIAYHM